MYTTVDPQLSDPRLSRADLGSVQRVPWNPPFERTSLTRDTLIEQSTSRFSSRAVTLFLRGVV